eukprot:15449252-Alexandrium_andersonii.AAC.1
MFSAPYASMSPRIDEIAHRVGTDPDMFKVLLFNMDDVRRGNMRPVLEKLDLGAHPSLGVRTDNVSHKVAGSLTYRLDPSTQLHVDASNSKAIKLKKSELKRLCKKALQAAKQCGFALISCPLNQIARSRIPSDASDKRFEIA